MNQISVYIIDDHKLFVQGLSSLINEVDGFQIVGFSLNPADFFENLNQLEATVYLIDINMPQMSGVELTSRLKERFPEIKILALTMYDEYEYIEKMIVAGASGYILKSASIQELTQGIRTIAMGSKYLGSDIQRVLFNKVEKASSGLQQSEQFGTNKNENLLTRREIEILVLIAKEMTTQQIAEQLFISERTVETHRKNIFSKTKAKTVIGLSKYAEKQGYLTAL